MPSPQHRKAVGWSLPEQRARILKARRRALVTVVVLTVGAVGMALAHLAAWWVIVPPSVMLAGLLLLLREAARIDGEQARAARVGFARSSRRREARIGGEQPSADPVPGDHLAADHPDGRLPGDRSTPEQAADARPGQVSRQVTPPTPTAAVIDLSPRAEDQLYDQYSDAAERAVGD